MQPRAILSEAQLQVSWFTGQYRPFNWLPGHWIALWFVTQPSSWNWGISFYLMSSPLYYVIVWCNYQLSSFSVYVCEKELVQTSIYFFRKYSLIPAVFQDFRILTFQWAGSFLIKIPSSHMSSLTPLAMAVPSHTPSSPCVMSPCCMLCIDLHSPWNISIHWLIDVFPSKCKLQDNKAPAWLTTSANILVLTHYRNSTCVYGMNEGHRSYPQMVHGLGEKQKKILKLYCLIGCTGRDGYRGWWKIASPEREEPWAELLNSAEKEGAEE